jgi:hypothetical protein
MNAQAFLWLLREATADQAERISRDLVANREQRWSQYVNRNLISYLKIKGG